jgi:hypothetical protein
MFEFHPHVPPLLSIVLRVGRAAADGDEQALTKRRGTTIRRSEREGLFTQ